MAKFKNQKCVYCLVFLKKLTKDHVFPQSWYPESTPKNIEKWTVPACVSCNNKFSQMEEELLDRFSMCIDESSVAFYGVGKKMQSLKKREVVSNSNKIRFILDTIKNYIPYPYEEGNKNVLKGGTPKEGVRGRLMIRIPTEKLFTVGEKILKGLEFKLRDKLIESDRKVCIIFPHENNVEEMKLINKWENDLLLPQEIKVRRGPGFVVRLGVNRTNSDWVVYSVRIWGELEMWALIYPKS